MDPPELSTKRLGRRSASTQTGYTVSGHAIDLVGTPSPYSRGALVDLCKTAYKGTGNGEDNLYPLRMANAIQKEVAFATAKATAVAVFRYPRAPAPALPSPGPSCRRHK